jgi:uncharacterized protein (DUF983 family)
MPTTILSLGGRVVAVVVAGAVTVAVAVSVVVAVAVEVAVWVAVAVTVAVVAVPPHPAIIIEMRRTKQMVIGTEIFNIFLHICETPFSIAVVFRFRISDEFHLLTE